MESGIEYGSLRAQSGVALETALKRPSENAEKKRTVHNIVHTRGYFDTFCVVAGEICPVDQRDTVLVTAGHCRWAYSRLVPAGSAASRDHLLTKPMQIIRRLGSHAPSLWISLVS